MNFALSSRQPKRAAWSQDRLEYERSIALGYTLEPSSIASYTSALHSYVSFCRTHDFPIEPTPDTLSFFIVYRCHYLKPKSVKSYLSGICNQLEVFYPDVCAARKSQLVTRTLTGCTKKRAIGTSRKRGITMADLQLADDTLSSSDDLDNTLFLAICHSSLHGLLRLGESVWPDTHKLRDYRKVVMRASVELSDSYYAYTLPGHKANHLYEGSRVLIHLNNASERCLLSFKCYIATRDRFFPYKPELWLRKDGSIPCRSWFLKMLSKHFTADDIGGHSFRSGGATYLASIGIAPHIIQAMGRWKSKAFEAYIREHPALLAAILYTSSPHTNNNNNSN